MLRCSQCEAHASGKVLAAHYFDIDCDSGATHIDQFQGISVSRPLGCFDALLMVMLSSELSCYWYFIWFDVLIQHRKSIKAMIFPNVISYSLPAMLPPLRGHPLKCSSDFPLTATLAAFNSLSPCNSLMLCPSGNTIRTIYHGKSSSKANRVSRVGKKASIVKKRNLRNISVWLLQQICFCLALELFVQTEYVATLTTKQNLY